jgi:hypothetical protein
MLGWELSMTEAAHDTDCASRRPVDAREEKNRGRDFERGLRDLEGEPWRRRCQEDDFRVGPTLEIEVKEQTDTTFTFNVVRCRYAETYKAMGLGEIGHLLSCNRDGAFCEGYDPKLKLDRSQTIMQGASHCDFKYTYK